MCEFRNEPFNGRHFIFGQEFGVYFVDAGFFGDGFRGSFVVSGQHDDTFDAGLMQLSDCLSRFHAYRIGQGNKAAHMLVVADDDYCSTCPLHLFELFVDF